jgi:6-phosphogluconolactonase
MDSRLDKPLVSVMSDRAALIDAAAQRIIAIGQDAIATRGQFAWALSGGSTPQPIFELLASTRFASALDWRRVQFFWSDERCVPPDHPESNFGMARAALLDKLAISATQVHRMHGEDDPEQAAAAYESELRAYRDSGLDLVQLGMGADGHTASLFPGTPALEERERWVVRNVSSTGTERLTFTFPAINAAAVVLFIVAGADKSKRVQEVLHGTQHNLPVQRVRPTSGRSEWLLDAHAAGELA